MVTLTYCFQTLLVVCTSFSPKVPILHGVISEASTQCHVSTTPGGTFTSLGRCICRASRILMVDEAYKLMMFSELCFMFLHPFLPRWPD